MVVSFQDVREEEPGAEWQRLFRRFWPAYRKWFFGPDASERPPRIVAEERLRQEMPELRPTYRRLLRLAGGGNEEARFLCLYRPAPYLTGCSQAVWTGTEPALVRNYDYDPRLWEAVLLSTAWTGRQVLAMSDCLWGVLDGINDAGLAVSLSFGGRKVVGDGFGCPLILRYVLEFCETTAEAARVLSRVPTHMAYNVTVVDRDGEYVTAHLSPDRPAVLRRSPIATNHPHDGSDWPHYVAATGSVERERILSDHLRESAIPLDRLLAAFRKPPVHSARYDKGMGTLYTAVYYPARRSMELLWDDTKLTRSLDQPRTGRRSFELEFRRPSEPRPGLTAPEEG